MDISDCVETCSKICREGRCYGNDALYVESVYDCHHACIRNDSEAGEQSSARKHHTLTK